MPLRAKLHQALRKAWRPLGRARRSRGFGVHSPFAFRFITFVLRDRRSIYYSTARIRPLASGRSHRNRLNRLFRIVCDRHPLALILPDNFPEAERRTLLMADSRLSPLTPAEAESAPLPSGRLMLCLHRLSEEHLPTARRVLSTEDSTLVILDIRPAQLSALKENLDHLMTFTNGRSAIIVSRHDLPLQTFEINI